MWLFGTNEWVRASWITVMPLLQVYINININKSLQKHQTLKSRAKERDMLMDVVSSCVCRKKTEEHPSHWHCIFWSESQWISANGRTTMITHEKKDIFFPAHRRWFHEININNVYMHNEKKRRKRAEALLTKINDKSNNPFRFGLILPLNARKERKKCSKMKKSKSSSLYESDSLRLEPHFFVYCWLLLGRRIAEKWTWRMANGKEACHLGGRIYSISPIVVDCI